MRELENAKDREALIFQSNQPYVQPTISCQTVVRTVYETDSLFLKPTTIIVALQREGLHPCLSSHLRRRTTDLFTFAS
jgi:hypothetical protein